MAHEFAAVDGVRLSTGWMADVTDGTVPASEEQVYAAVRTMNGLTDNDRVLMQLPQLITRVEGERFWRIPLSFENVVRLAQATGNVYWQAGGCTVWVDLEEQFGM